MTADPRGDGRDALVALMPADPSLRSGVTLRGESALLSLVSASDPTARAVVRCTESTWFSLVVDGRFRRDVIDVHPTGAELHEHLADLLAIAVAHLRGDSRVVRKRGVRRLAVTVDDAELLLSAPRGRILARLSPRRVRTQIRQIAGSLLTDHRLPAIAHSWMILHPEMWELLIDLDALQAGLAGSEAWRRSIEGRRIRSELMGEALLIAVAAADRGLVDVAVGLADIAALIEQY